MFGTKVVSTLEPVQVEAEGFNFSGFVSSAVKSGSKTNADKQFFFLNGRPVELPKALRVVNDVYRCVLSSSVFQDQHIDTCTASVVCHRPRS